MENPSQRVTQLSPWCIRIRYVDDGRCKAPETRLIGVNRQCQRHIPLNQEQPPGPLLAKLAGHYSSPGVWRRWPGH